LTSFNFKLIYELLNLFAETIHVTIQGEKSLTQNRSQQPKPAHRSQLSKTTIAYGYGETVLLIERNASLLELGKNALEKLNYQVITATDADDFARHCDLPSCDIDLLILDGEAPIKESKEIVRQVHQHCPEAKTLFASVHDATLETECGKKIDGEKIINKPYTIHSLSQIVYQTLH